jgi:hypothetical protein
MPSSICTSISSTARPPKSVRSICNGVRSLYRSFGLLSHLRARSASPKTDTAWSKMRTNLASLSTTVRFWLPKQCEASYGSLLSSIHLFPHGKLSNSCAGGVYESFCAL